MHWVRTRGCIAGPLERRRRVRVGQRLACNASGIAGCVRLALLAPPSLLSGPRGHTSRTSTPRWIRNIVVCRPIPVAFSIPNRDTGANDWTHSHIAR